MSQERVLTVSSLYDDKDRVKPFIRLSGYWLRDAGFETNSKIKVTIADGKLIVEKYNPAEKNLGASI